MAGFLVIFGGEDPGRHLLGDLHVLHVDTMTWREVTVTGTAPSPRSAHTAIAYLDRYVVVFGGRRGGDMGWRFYEVVNYASHVPYPGCRFLPSDRFLRSHFCSLFPYRGPVP